MSEGGASFKDRVISALGWSAGAQVAVQATRMLITLLLTRLLTPEDFGVVAGVVVVVELVAIVADFGLAQALIRLETLERRHLKTAWTINLALGLGLFGLFWACAPLLARFYDAPIVLQLARVLALQFVLSALSSVPMAVLQRELDFKRLMRVEVLSLMPAGALAVGLALSGFGVWSLVLYGLANGLLKLLMLLPGARPGLGWDTDVARDLMGFGGNILGSRLLNAVAERLAYFVIGGAVSTTALGHYSRAYELMRMPLRQFGNVAGRVLFPALSSIRDDHGRSQHIMLLAHRMMALVGFPAWAGFAVVADDATWVVIGAQWGDATPLFRMFAIMCIPGVIGVSVGWVMQAQNRADLVLKWNIYSVVMRIAGVFIGVRWGAMGVATALTVVTWVFYLLPGWYLSMNLIGVKLSRTIRNVAPPALATAAMCAVVAAVMPWLDGLPHRWMQLGIEVAVGVAVYVGLCAGFRMQAWQDATRLVRERVVRRMGQGA